MRKLIVPLFIIVFLLQWASVSRANDSGVELVASQLEVLPFQWYLQPIQAGNITQRKNGYGIINVKPGRYQLKAVFDKGVQVTLNQLEVTENKIEKVTLNTGVTVVPLDGITPNTWYIKGSNNKLYASVKKQWGTVALEPGDYHIEVFLPKQSNAVKRSFTVVQGQQVSVNVGTGVSLHSKIITQAPQKWSLKSISDQKIGFINNRWGIALVPPGEYQLQVKFQHQSWVDYKKITVERDKITPVNIDTGIQLQSVAALEKFSLYDVENRRSFSSLREPFLLPAPPGRYTLSIKLKNQSQFNYQSVDIKQGKLLTVSIDTGIKLQQSAAIDGTIKAHVYLKKNNQMLVIASSLDKFIAIPPGDYYIALSAKDQTPTRYIDTQVKPKKVLTVPVNTAVAVSANPIFGKPRQWELISTEASRKRTSIRNRWGLAPCPPGQYILEITLPNQARVNYGLVDIVADELNDLSIESGLALTTDKPDRKTTLLVYRLGESKPVYRSKLASMVLPLSPGQYRVISKSSEHYTWGPIIDIQPGEVRQLTDSFIEPESIDAAIALDTRVQASNVNIAKKTLGGSVASVSSQSAKKEWQATNLIDGFDYIRNLLLTAYCEKSCGWLSQQDQINPAELTLSFYQERLATIESVIIDDAFVRGAAEAKQLPRRVSIWVSSQSPTDGFTKVAEAKLEPTFKPQRISLPPSTQAKYIKVKVVSTYGSNQVRLGEVSVIENDTNPSIIHDLEKDLARPENGGALVWFSSQNPGKTAAQIIWQGDPTWPSPWHSYTSQAGAANYLPQDIVLGFYNSRIARVDHITIDPSGLDLSDNYGRGNASLAKEIVIEASLESPVTGFEEVARVALLPEPTPQKFTINTQARFIKLRVTETQGKGHFVKLGKVSVIESNQPGYQSILLGQHMPSALVKDTTKAEATSTSLGVELEPNNTQKNATPLSYEQWMSGTITPLGEDDYYRLTVPIPAIVTSELHSEPFIQTYLSVYDTNGNRLYDFSPKNLLSNRKVFSLQMPAGDYLYHLTQAPTSIVLIWDTSGSMKGNEKDLSSAVMGFIEKIRPSEQLQLIKFSSAVKVLTTEFTHDIDALKLAAENHFTPKGSTRLYDAIETGLDLLANEKGNKAIVVMTDGQDSASTKAYPDLWHKVRQQNARIYTVGLGDTLQKYNYKMGATGKQLLEHLALATDARNLYADTSEQLPIFYQSLVSELTSQASYKLKVTSDDRLGLLRLTTGDKLLSNTTTKNFELILDASGSMRAQNSRIDGELKIDVAKNVLIDFIHKLPETSHLAFRVFGHRIKEYDEGDCQDTELLYPLGPLNRDQLINTVNKINVSNGTTPLSYSIIQAAKDLISIKGEKKIILVTDGEEYCGADPENIVKKMIEMGIDIHIDIVGMDLKNKAVRENMRRIAHTTGGQFYNVTTKEGFGKAIESVLGVSFSVVDSAGNNITKGNINGQAIKLAQGVYTISVKSLSGPVIVGEVFVKANDITTVDIVKNGALLAKATLASEQAQKHHWRSAEQSVQKAVTIEKILSPVNIQKSLMLLETHVLQAKTNRPAR